VPTRRISGEIWLFEKKWPGDSGGHRDGCATLLFTNKMFFSRSAPNVIRKKIELGIPGTRSMLFLVFTHDAKINFLLFWCYFLLPFRLDLTNSYPIIYWNRQNQRIYVKWFSNNIKKSCRRQKKSACYNFLNLCGRSTNMTKNSSNAQSE